MSSDLKDPIIFFSHNLAQWYPVDPKVNNYANVDLICKIAQSEKVDAVWPGLRGTHFDVTHNPDVLV